MRGGVGGNTQFSTKRMSFLWLAGGWYVSSVWLIHKPAEYSVGEKRHQRACFTEGLSIGFEPTLRGQVSSLNRAVNGASLKPRTHAGERT
jgi:hypothetical protein